MARKDDFSFEVDKVIGYLNEEKSGWVKGVVLGSWGDSPKSINIRTMNESKNIYGKGISLTHEETDSLCDILLNAGYGSVEQMEAALKIKRKRYSISQEEVDLWYESETITVEED